MRIATTLMALALVLLPFSAPASATTIKRVVSPKGIEAWLVEEHSVPLIAMDYAFRGGSVQDPDGKPGVASLMASLMDEGAGELNSQAFQQAMQNQALEFSFSADAEHLLGSVRVLTANRDASFELMRLALNQPRFDQEAIDRIRASVIARLQSNETEPNAIAGRLFNETAFAGHPYSRPTLGTLESVPKLTREDIVAYRQKTLARDTLKIAVVGDIDAATLAPLLDKVFGALPAKAELRPIPDIEMKNLGKRKLADLDTPQTVVRFSLPGLKRSDPDFIAATVMNHIYGGGSFSSRLWTEVREKRGLAYSIGTFLQPYEHAGLLAGSTSVRNDKAADSVAIIEAETKKMATEGPTQAELDKAKSFLIGSYLLRFDTSAKIAGQLLAIQLDNLGIDYIDKRNDMIRAVTLEDAKRVAKRLLSAAPLVVLVGRPQGLSEKSVR